MRSRRPSSEHEEAVSRRLAQLSAELSASRLESVPPISPPIEEPAAGGEWWADHTRVTASRTPLALVPSAGEKPGEIEKLPAVAEPTPGRHSSRAARSWSALLPSTLQGRVGLLPAHLTSVAVVIAVAMALTTWWLVRGDAREVTTAPTSNAPAEALVSLPEQPNAGAPTVGGSPGSAETPGAGLAASTVTVDVAGKVRRPGIAVLDTGARVIDAVQAAGGAKPGVDLTSINLARLLVDGEQIVVGARVTGAPAAGAPAASGAGDTGSVALVNLNLAGQSELETLPQVGPVTAASILAWREQNGGFTAVEELLEVDGIGEKTLAQIAPFATV